MSTIRKTLNLNTVLAVLGALALFGPDLASVAATIDSLGVPRLATVAKVLGALALLLSSLPRIITRLRPVLALLGLATPPSDVVTAQSDDVVTTPETPNAKAQEIVNSATKGPTMKLLTLTLAFLALFTLAAPAQAQTDVAPFAGRCFGDGTSTCLVPELSFDVAQLYVNGPRKGTFSAGAVPVGAGYALLLGYDQWWASGPAVHAVLDFAQQGPSMIQVSAGLTFLRYGHAGVIGSRLDGFTQYGVFAGLVAPLDIVTTSVAERKAKAVRAARMGAAQ